MIDKARFVIFDTRLNRVYIYRVGDDGSMTSGHGYNSAIMIYEDTMPRPWMVIRAPVLSSELLVEVSPFFERFVSMHLRYRLSDLVRYLVSTGEFVYIDTLDGLGERS